MYGKWLAQDNSLYATTTTVSFPKIQLTQVVCLLITGSILMSGKLIALTLRKFGSFDTISLAVILTAFFLVWL